MDAFAQTWRVCVNLIVPPPCYGSLVLKKVLKEKAECTLVLPKWMASPYWCLLVEKTDPLNRS